MVIVPKGSCDLFGKLGSFDLGRVSKGNLAPPETLDGRVVFGLARKGDLVTNKSPEPPLEDLGSGGLGGGGTAAGTELDEA